MFKVCVHTMATPEMAVEEAISLVSRLGFDGIEIVCNDDYKCAIPVRPDKAQLSRLKSLARDNNLAIANLVPYAKEFNSLIGERRKAAIEEIKRVADIANTLGCSSIRILAGEDATDQAPASTDQLIASLGEIAEFLRATDITANIENHVATEAVSAAKTLEIVQRVNSEHIGIIYDPANLIVLGDQDYKKSYKIQAPFINHIHLKDLLITTEARTPEVTGGRTLTFPAYHPQQFGKGQIPLSDILSLVTADCYSRFISIEYEKRWHPRILPDPEIALPQELEYLNRYRNKK